MLRTKGLLVTVNIQIANRFALDEEVHLIKIDGKLGACIAVSTAGVQ